MGREYSTYGEEEDCIKDFGGKRKETTRRPRRRQEDNTGMFFGLN
jgi:hypothetical protein